MTRRTRTATPPSRRQPRQPGVRPLEFFYGTAALYSDAILKDGLRPYRRSGRTSFATAYYKAVCYAKSWALGLHAAGLADRPEGVILGLSYPADTSAYLFQLHEYMVDGGVPARRIRPLERIDCSGLSEVERAGHLFQFSGILGNDGDPYTDDRFRSLSQTIHQLVSQMPGDLITAGLNAVPVI